MSTLSEVQAIQEQEGLSDLTIISLLCDYIDAYGHLPNDPFPSEDAPNEVPEVADYIHKRSNPEDEWIIIHTPSGETVKDGFESEAKAYAFLDEGCSAHGELDPKEMDEYAVEKVEA